MNVENVENQEIFAVEMYFLQVSGVFVSVD